MENCEIAQKITTRMNHMQKKNNLNPAKNNTRSNKVTII